MRSIHALTLGYMVKTTLYLLTLGAYLGIGCLPIADERPTTDQPKTNSSVGATELKTLDGYWILTDYFDNILEDQAIAKHRLYPLAWSTMNFKIHADSLFSTGLLFIKKQVKIHPDRDTLALIDDFGSYVFRYDRQSDKIFATDNAHDKNKFNLKTYTYRRVTEKQLLKILDSEDAFEIQKGFYQLFIDRLIAGEYKSIVDGQVLKLTNSGRMSGFKKYNSYHIHDYFGTYHPFQNYDAICFKDTTMVSLNNTPPTSAQLCYYNWTFSGDTLTLTELLTENYDEYFLGKKIHTFIKTKELSH